MLQTAVDGLPVRLREPHDLGFLARWGTVFRVLDEQDSGNLCFGVDGPDGPVFVKYAGAATQRYPGVVADAVDRLRAAAQVYRELAHPTLVRLREHVELERGVALVFDWTDAVPLGRQYEQLDRLWSLSVAARVDAVQQIYDFSEHAAARGWVAIDLYDGSVMVEIGTGRVVLCDLDVYRLTPTVNDMGRMWGSTRFMSPEEHQLGATIDEVSTVVTLGALAHTFLGDDATKAREAWTGGDERFRIAARALDPDRDRRWPSVAALAQAWRDAAPSDPRT